MGYRFRVSLWLGECKRFEKLAQPWQSGYFRTNTKNDRPHFKTDQILKKTVLRMRKVHYSRIFFAFGVCSESNPIKT